MGVVWHREIQLESPDLLCSWPGIGNIGIIAVDTLKGQVMAEELGEIEPWDFFEPRKVIISGGLLEDLIFPSSKFFFKKLKRKDMLFFVGEEQPSEKDRFYARGEKAYRMASIVVDVAEKFGCRRIYTSGACVSPSHHLVKPRAVAVVTSEKLKKEIKKYPNVVLMDEVGEGGEGIITGLNGLLLAVAKKRGLEAVCLMGEIPDWLSRAPFPYPKASKSVLEVLAAIYGIKVDFQYLDKKIAEVEGIITALYEKFPQDVKEVYDLRKSLAEPGPISKDEAEWMKEHLDEFLKSLLEKEGGGNEDGERPV